jgi:hypothetical protein
MFKKIMAVLIALLIATILLKIISFFFTIIFFVFKIGIIAIFAIPIYLLLSKKLGGRK